jgi:hypothetical protein
VLLACLHLDWQTVTEWILSNNAHRLLIVSCNSSISPVDGE